MAERREIYNIPAVLSATAFFLFANFFFFVGACKKEKVARVRNSLLLMMARV